MESDQAELLKTISSFLSSHHIPYMITGAWSVIYYARPRASHDIDFVVEITKADTNRVLKAIKELPTEYSIQPQAVYEAIRRKSMFNIIHLPTYLKLDFWLLQPDEFDKTRFHRKKRVRLLGRNMIIAAPEDTILKKLLWHKGAKIEKHLIDAAFVYQIQKEKLDMKYLVSWAKKLGIARTLDRLATLNLDHYI